MPKIKVPRSSPSLDMTPMVDLAFLLVTFFMLTTQFRATEPVIVDTPNSTFDKVLPDNVMLVTVDSGGRPFFNMDGRDARIKLLTDMGAKYKVNFTDEEKARFAVMTSFGVPMNRLKEYINMQEAERNQFVTKGIPMDSTNNELGDWIYLGRIAAATIAQQNKSAGKAWNELRIAIKGDGRANYEKVKEVMDVFQKKDVYRFNLITDLEQADS